MKDHELLKNIKRICDIVVNNCFGHDELDRLAFYVGHHPDIFYSEKDPELCAWTQDPDGIWYASCEHAHEFNTGTPEENDHRYCPYCGKALETKEPIFDESDI